MAKSFSSKSVLRKIIRVILFIPTTAFLYIQGLIGRMLIALGGKASKPDAFTFTERGKFLYLQSCYLFVFGGALFQCADAVLHLYPDVASGVLSTQHFITLGLQWLLMGLVYSFGPGVIMAYTFSLVDKHVLK